MSTTVTAAGPKVVLTAGDAPTGTPAVRCSDAPPCWKMSTQETSSRDCTSRLVTTRLVGFGADGLHLLLGDAAFTNFAGGDGSLTETLPYHSDVRCRLERTERLGRTLERDAAAAEGESAGCATCVNSGEEERNAKIPSQREQRDRWFKNKTKTEAATSSVAVVSIDGLVAGTPLPGVHVQRTFSEMSLTRRPFFCAVSSQCQ